MTNFALRLLDPRPQSLESEIEFLSKFSGLIIGLEVTIPALAECCNLHIDPQHDGSNTSLCCIEAVMQNLPIVSEWDNIILCTVRADLDALASMLIIAKPYLLQQLQVVERLNTIAIADKSNLEKWEPKPLFTESENTLAALARCVSDFKVTIEQRLGVLKEWLLSGETESLAAYRVAFEKEQIEIRENLETGKTIVEKHQVRDTLGITYVESSLRAATTIGYTSSPVVVAFNPQFHSKDGLYAKYTVCQYNEGYIDLVAVKEELQQLESGWGGSTTIIGSP